MTHAFTPVGDNVLIRLAPVETVTKSGLHLPCARHDHSTALPGLVEAVGAKVNGLKVGDLVFAEKSAGALILLGGKEHLVQTESQVLAKLDV